MSWWSFSHHLHTNFLVLFKAAHMSAENSSLLLPDLYLDANSFKPPASSQHSCVPDVYTQASRKPGTAPHSPVSLHLCIFLSLSLSLLHTLRQAHTCEHPPGTGLADAGAQVQTAILKHREESGEGTSGCQGPPATELGSHMCFITNPLAILQGKNYYLPWRN